MAKDEPTNEDSLADDKEELAEIFFQCARYERNSTDWIAALDAYTDKVKAFKD